MGINLNLCVDIASQLSNVMCCIEITKVFFLYLLQKEQKKAW